MVYEIIAALAWTMILLALGIFCVKVYDHSRVIKQDSRFRYVLLLSFGIILLQAAALFGIVLLAAVLQ